MQFLESKTITRDIAEILLGQFIARGSAREVYECRLDKSLVVKIEDKSSSFQNIKEWETWQDVQYNKKLSKWFTPCIDISPCGTVLIQKRAEYIPVKDYPSKIPACFGDLKYTNFGIYNKHFVCFDYGTITTSNGLRDKMVKPKWWSE